MIAEVEAGNIDTIIVKDMSRFGRNYLQVGFYTEILFPQKNVRFIAINNNIDSEKADENEFAPFLNIMNEWYAKDTSNKIKAIFDARMKDGKRCSGSVPFGYRKSENDKNLLVPDAEAASVVKRIFTLFDEGHTSRDISEILKKEEVLIPAAYAKQHNVNNRKCTFSNPYEWRMTTVNKILNREEYLGHTVLHKSVATNFKLHKRKDLPKEEQYIFYNTHEPIISQDLWDRVQRRRNRVKRMSAWGMHKHRLSGYLFCADCKRQMSLQTHYAEKDRSVKYGFRCSGYANQVDSCSTHGISANVIEAVLLETVRCLFKRVNIDEENFANELKKQWEETRNKISEQNRAVLNKLKRRNEELNGLIKGLYENLMSGILPERQYKMLSGQYDEEQAHIEAEIKETEILIAKETECSLDTEKFISIIRKYTVPTELTDMMLNELIDKVYIHEAVGKGNSRTRQIDIYFNFIGQLDLSPTPEEIEEERLKEIQIKEERKKREKKRAAKYRAKRKAAKIAANGGKPLNTKICTFCGITYLSESNSQQFCSKDCLNAFRQKQRQEARIKERGDHKYRQKTCIICGKSYYPNSSVQKTCSEECRKKRHNKIAIETYHKKKGEKKIS